jgi:signal transduction histidine kinase
MTAVGAMKFDREFSVRDLLTEKKLGALEHAMRALLGPDARLVDAAGQPVFGSRETGERRRVALRIELEPVGYLEAGGSEEQLRAAAVLLEQLLRSAARYRMASALHLEAVHADYEQLQRKHEALKESEARYKALAENLEQRVQEQVKTIESAQRQLYQSEKLASVGQLAAGVAHEINNPTGFIMSNLGTAQLYVRRFADFGRQLHAGSDVQHLVTTWQENKMDGMLEDFSSLLQESLDGASRVARIVADLKAFSNVDREAEELVDLNHVIRTVCNVAAAQFRPHAKLALDLGTLPMIRCRPGHLGQVILNMLRNAVQAMSRRPGEVGISTRAGGDEITVSVSDTGTGIPESQLSRIFEPFFTTREIGQGTGLGLTVSRDIVQAHGGHITVDSRPGVGTTFTIHLPARE